MFVISKIWIMPTKQPPNIEQAEILALQALTFLSSDDDRITRFLTITGIIPTELSNMAQDSASLGAILDYILGWEPLLMEFAQSQEIDPSIIRRMRQLLPGAEI